MTTHNDMPQAIDALRQQSLEQDRKLDLLISILNESKNLPKQKKPVRIEIASEITGLSIPTLYVKARNGEIKSYKAGKFIYFYEDELLEFIQNGRRKTNAEIIETAELYSRKR